MKAVSRSVPWARWLAGLLAVCMALGMLGCEQRTSSPTVEPTVSVPSVVPPPASSANSQARLAGAREAARIGEWEQAMVVYESLREDAELAATALLELGDLYLADGQAVAAAAAWQIGLSRVEAGSPQEAAYRYRLGRGFAAVEQHEEAIEQWQRVDALTDAADGVLAQQLADSYDALDEAAQVAEQLTRVYEHAGTNRVARALSARRVGDYWADEERWEEALLWYERTLELSQVESFRAELIARMAELALELDDRGYAQNQWQTLIDEYPSFPEALAAVRQLEARGVATPLDRVATLYVENGRWVSAERTYELLLQRSPDDPLVYQGLAEMLARAGRWSEAEAAWQRLLDELDDVPPEILAEAWAGRVEAQWQQGDGVAAEESLDTLLGDFPDSEAAPRALWEWAERLRLGSEPLLEQVAAYEALIERYPDAPQSDEARWTAGLLRYRAGQAGQAARHWEALAERGRAYEGPAAFWAGKAAAATGDEQTAQMWWQRATAADASYPTLRARALREEQSWQPRADRPYRYPADEADEVGWLAERLDLAEGEIREAEPQSALFAQGEQLLAWGERQRAITHFLEAIRQSEDELELWATATRLQSLDVSSMSQAAAFRLMSLMEIDVTEAPLALLALAYPLPFEPELRAAADQYGIDPLFLAALIHRESAWEPAATSSAAARGLTQVIPDTGAWIATRLGDNDYEYPQLDRPVVALRYGAYYLDYVLRQFDDNPWHALAAYNAGPGNAQRWIVEDDDLYVALVPFPETKLYLETVYERWWAYDRLYRDQSSPLRGG